MPGNLFPRAGFRLSEGTLRKQMGQSPMFEFLRMYAGYDRYRRDHYFDQALDTGFWTTANSAGTSAANFATVVGAGPGYIEGDTGTTDNGSISLIGPIIFDGDHNCGVEFDIQIDAVTGYNLELGMIDAVPGSNGSGVSDIDTPALTASDAAILQIDTDQTLATLAFATDGSTANMDAQATTLVTTTNFTAATRHIVTIQQFGNFAACWVDGHLEAVHDASVDPQGCVEGGTLLAPWVYCRTRNTTAKFPRIYRVSMWQDWRS